LQTNDRLDVRVFIQGVCRPLEGSITGRFVYHLVLFDSFSWAKMRCSGTSKYSANVLQGICKPLEGSVIRQKGSNTPGNVGKYVVYLSTNMDTDDERGKMPDTEVLRDG